MRIEHINEDFSSTDLNYNIITFITSDFILCKDKYLIFIKKKYNSIKELKKTEKKSGEVAYIYKNNKYIFYIIISDYIENSINIVNILKALCSLKKLIECLKITDIMTSHSHVEDTYDSKLIYTYLKEIMPEDLNLYLLL
ncbi:unknown similar to AMEV247 [Choristoneura rosaceana entomopoxvirus 'L']|uniref:N1R/p28-like protein n=1 Tax=Choristoneura rosaceana entomopoxvirus 'L' TaxID=1293539 RepID=A0ABM9QKR2_9POXV|nr:unknown similar to AMEV247 [Choristoneura rosaceana entomopoxvirus 'L']CCU56152.1 unknown similar to AMEV247 [Choristoneura rosaceana entomopoxvirus 'L']